MKILFVLENYYPNIGGVETLFKTLAEELVAREHQVTVVTTLPEKSDAPRLEQKGNLTIRRIAFPNRYFFTFFGVFIILRYIKEHDLVHTTSYNAGLPAILAGKLLGKKTIITFHEVWGNLWFRLPYFGRVAQWGHYLFEQFLLKMPFDHFVAVSESTKKSLIENGISSKKITTIYNGIDYSEFPQRSLSSDNKKQINNSNKSNDFTYTFFGRLGISKGIDILLDAATLVKKELPNSRLQMIIPKTPATFFKIIKEEIEKKELSDYIILKHHLPFKVLQQTLMKSDCVVIPSYSEGFCYAAVECIAMQIPIISSDQKALREVVSGTFIKMKRHDVVNLVNALSKAYRQEWDNAPIRKFLIQDTIHEYLCLYEDFV
ncbi:MAG: glycosyltransferase family 4 protein [Bacteroidota bacterium]